MFLLFLASSLLLHYYEAQTVDTLFTEVAEEPSFLGCRRLTPPCLVWAMAPSPFRTSKRRSQPPHPGPSTPTPRSGGEFPRRALAEALCTVIYLACNPRQPPIGPIYIVIYTYTNICTSYIYMCVYIYIYVCTHVCIALQYTPSFLELLKLPFRGPQLSKSQGKVLVILLSVTLPLDTFEPGFVLWFGEHRHVFCWWLYDCMRM